jgi:ribosomal protein S6
VPRFNETKAIAWKNYCRPISDKKLYFPPRFFEADVTTRYAKWWKQSVLGEYDFVKNIMKRKRSASSRKHRRYVGKAKSSNDVGVPPGFPPNLVDTLNFGKFCDDGSNTKTRKVVDLYADDPYESILPLKRSVSKDNIVLSIGSFEKDFNDANGSKEARMSSDRVYLSETQGERCSYAIRNKASSSNKVKAMQQHDLQFHSDKAAQAEAKESVEERERKKKDKVMVLFKEQCLKNQEELARLARQQEEILRLMVLREKRDEELRQLIVNVLSNQQPSSSS